MRPAAGPDDAHGGLRNVAVPCRTHVAGGRVADGENRRGGARPGGDRFGFTRNDWKALLAALVFLVAALVLIVVLRWRDGRRGRRRPPRESCAPCGPRCSKRVVGWKGEGTTTTVAPAQRSMSGRAAYSAPLPTGPRPPRSAWRYLFGGTGVGGGGGGGGAGDQDDSTELADRVSSPARVAAGAGRGAPLAMTGGAGCGGRLDRIGVPCDCACDNMCGRLCGWRTGGPVGAPNAPGGWPGDAIEEA
jgi:hypothetical protein